MPPELSRRLPERKTPRGMPNYSNRFFTFANRVAAELGRTHPAKFLGCLAYHVTEPPPTIDVHPRIVPFLTAGRANWTDPAIREGDQKLIQGWCQKVPVVGIYDYYYGSGFISPRIFTGLTEASVKFAHRTGVRAFYAEIYSTWSLDGPKAYVASQMLWDVNQSAESLVDDFCRGLFGKIAVQYGQYTRGAQVSFVNPYFLDYRVALGLDVFYKQQNPTSYVSYGTKTVGFAGRLGQLFLRCGRLRFS